MSTHDASPTGSPGPDLPPPLTLAGYESRAVQALPDAIRAYVFGGAGAGRGIDANLSAWQGHRLLPRALRGRTAGGSTAVALPGADLAHPFLVAPMALHRLCAPDGEVATAMAAAAQGGVMTVSTESSVEVERIAAAAPGPLWFQLYPRHDPAQSVALMRRAEDAGCTALVITVDAPFTPPRPAEIAAGFRLPDGVRPVHLSALPGPAFAPLAEGESAVFDRLLPAAPDWGDVERLIKAAAAPVYLKGVLSPADARRAVEAGAAGIIVSNHGGRLLESLPTALEMLPRVVEATRGAVPLIVDGGVRRGEDALIARALGADAVMVGRPVLAGLAVGGAQGASHVLRILRDELEVAMGLLGLRALEEAGPELLLRP
ncbi:alpha-hydroxy acid oxidase [Rhodovulum sp. DZ06]|uniref:alpha-hydroxy acid oxidase n=1 Tax=Rhodovulum sp. DZ06 TaxID=3425126 RepID=UPI003D33D0A1